MAASSSTRTALVTGATGVVGRNLIARLTRQPGWRVIAVSRRTPDVGGGYTHIAADLLDRDDCRRKLGGLSDVTHVFHSAYIERATPAEMVAPNLTLLVNVLDAVEPVAQGLEHVHFTQGTKYYGSHLGPFRTPAKEDDPRHLPPNFYYDLQDCVMARQARARWTWSAARPHAVIGFALGNPMNLSTVIAVYATILKALGLPLSFPGTPAAFHALYQCTDADLLARAMEWMATTPACANQAYNITNGDLIRWENFWPRLAAFFGMEPGPVRQLPLVRMMADKAPLWERIVAEHGLAPHAFERIVSWPYGDIVFSTGHDIVSDTQKARRAGYTDCLDTERMFLDLFARYRTEKIIP